jgi:hypothetical protein
VARSVWTKEVECLECQQYKRQKVQGRVCPWYGRAASETMAGCGPAYRADCYTSGRAWRPAMPSAYGFPAFLRLLPDIR